MKELGNGFEIIQVGQQKLVQSIPYELSTDHMSVIANAQPTGYVTVSQLIALGWRKDRITVALVIL